MVTNDSDVTAKAESIRDALFRSYHLTARERDALAALDELLVLIERLQQERDGALAAYNHLLTLATKGADDAR